MSRDELHSAAVDEFASALAEHKHLLETGSRKTINVKLTTTKIEGGHRIAGTCTANGKKHFSFGTIVARNPEEL
jgi:hypothetical protein